MKKYQLITLALIVSSVFFAIVLMSRSKPAFELSSDIRKAMASYPEGVIGGEQGGTWGRGAYPHVEHEEGQVPRMWSFENSVDISNTKEMSGERYEPFRGDEEDIRRSAAIWRIADYYMAKLNSAIPGTLNPIANSTGTDTVCDYICVGVPYEGHPIFVNLKVYQPRPVDPNLLIISLVIVEMSGTDSIKVNQH